MAQYHYRERPFTVQMVDSINFDKAMKFYRSQFSDASGFTFFFVGNFDSVTIKPFVEQYLAALPPLNREETWHDSGIKPPKGVISKKVMRGIEPKSLVRIMFTGPFEWSRQNRYDFESLLEYLNIKLREVMREDKSGVYGVSASGSPSLHPRKEYGLTISFGCSPARVDELVAVALQQIDSLKNTKPGDDYVVKVKEIQRRQHEVNLKQNGWWLNSLRFSYVNGGDPKGILRYPGLVDSLSASAIQEAAGKYCDMNNYVEVVLVPEKN
jgi:zinc protease